MNTNCFIEEKAPRQSTPEPLGLGDTVTFPGSTFPYMHCCVTHVHGNGSVNLKRPYVLTTDYSVGFETLEFVDPKRLVLVERNSFR
jgi:hypothetical protein